MVVKRTYTIYILSVCISISAYRKRIFIELFLLWEKKEGKPKKYTHSEYSNSKDINSK